MRTPYLIDREFEYQLLKKLVGEMHKKFPGVNASNSIILNVSPDYSSMVSMYLAHQLSHEGEMCNMMHVDVPYPDQYVHSYKFTFEREMKNTPIYYDNYILCEAGVIRGSNYTWITQVLREYIPKESKIITLAMCENTGSNFKSDIVGHYYDDQTQDLTLYFETYNKHWDKK